MDESGRRSAGRIDELPGGDDAALDELVALLYDELRQIAHRQRRRWRGDETLNTTALVHEAYLKLIGPAEIDVRSRAHFLALASRAMRHVLCNYSRDRRARKRGGGMEVVSLDDSRARRHEIAVSGAEPTLLTELDQALRQLERIDLRQARVVECRFFGGLTVEETAAALGVSPRTVKRDWSVAQAWLHREMKAGA